MQPSTTIAAHAGGRAKLRSPPSLGSLAALIAVVLISSTAGSNILDWLLVIDGFVAASWWALSRHRRPDALQVLSLGALLLAIATLASQRRAMAAGAMAGTCRVGRGCGRVSTLAPRSLAPLAPDRSDEACS